MNALENTLNISLLRRAQQLTIYFVLATIAGYYIETVWRFFRYEGGDLSFIVSQLSHLPLAEPYGLGAVAVATVALPIAHHYKLTVPGVYVLNVFTTAATEYACAVALVLTYGSNKFWDYSGQFLNLHGYISLETSLLFGLAAMVFIYYIYPWSEHKLGRFSNQQLGLAAAVAAGLYIAGLFLSGRM